MKLAQRCLALAVAATQLVGCSAHASSPRDTTSSRARYESGGFAGPTMEALASGSSDLDSADGEAESTPVSPTQTPAPPPGMPGTKLGKATSDDAGNTQKKPSPTRSPESRSPILIYTGDFVLAVYETQRTLDAVQSFAERSGGFLSKRSDSSITVRVPADRFQDAVAEIQSLGEVVRRNVTSEDVTAEFRDLEVQLANAIAMRDRFAALLAKVTTVADSLTLERELGRVTATIERIRGRLKVLADLAAYSTLTVDVQRKQSAIMKQGPFNLPLPWLENVGLPRLMNL